MQHIKKFNKLDHGVLSSRISLGETKGKKFYGQFILSSSNKIRLKITSSKDNNKSPVIDEYDIPSPILNSIFEMLPQYRAFLGQKNQLPDQQEFLIFPVPKSNYTASEKEKLAVLFTHCLTKSTNFIKELIESSFEISDVTTNLINMKRNKIALEKFKKMLLSCDKESEWKKLFCEFPWLLGLGCSTIDTWEIDKEQFPIRPPETRCESTNKGDYLLVSRGHLKFTAILEIKTPDTPLIKSKEFRAGIYSTDQSLNDSVAQLRMYRKRWEAQQYSNSKDKKFTIDPKAFLIVGNLKEVSDDANKADAFQLFRRNQKDVEIFTFDELLQCAQSRLDIQEKNIEISNNT